ncbi:MAG: GNAT family N-acetyltransferase [Magnetococcales bacterium]|nr:GNAT family N-acetyltransferase [Magnetococcales bacterium]
MSLSNLEKLFKPRSIAIIGASNRPDSLGAMVMRNLLLSDFHGPVMPVNPRYESVLRVLCYPSVETLPISPDLAILCTPPPTIAPLIEQLGSIGNRMAVVMTVDPDSSEVGEKTSFTEEISKVARISGVRLLGSGSTGIQVPGIGLNASWIHTTAQKGKLAIVSQSGSLVAGVLEWATAKGVGFSHVISVGDSVDVDLADILDSLALEPNVQAVLLYIRSIHDSRRFLSAARAISRIKPVITIKANRRNDGTIIVNADENSQEYSDEVFDAAVRRAGMLRVTHTDELFDAVETLANSRPFLGNSLVVLCNGSGPAEVAVDILVAGGSQLHMFDQETSKALSAVYAGSGPPRIPLDIGRDADASRYRAVMDILLKAKGIHGILVMHAPTPMAPGDKVAEVVTELCKKSMRNVMACWLGMPLDRLDHLRKIFIQAHVSLFSTPDKAARGFHYLASFQRNQDMMLQSPVYTSRISPAQREENIKEIEKIMSEGCYFMDEEQTAKLLESYEIQSPKTRIANTLEDVVNAAAQVGYPVSLRPCSKSIIAKYFTGHMVTDVSCKEEATNLGQRMLEEFQEHNPGEAFPGFVVQEMVRRPNNLVIMAGIANDSLFGKLIRFGPGGARTHIRKDRAVTLPPLNMSLAKELITRTSIGTILDTQDGRKLANSGRIQQLLVRISELVIDYPQIQVLDMNPILAGPDDCLVIDARIALSDVADNTTCLAIRPYPRELEENIILRDGRNVLVRPVLPEDEVAYKQLILRTSSRDRQLRFCGEMTNLTPELLAQLIHIDYDREMAFMAMTLGPQGEPECLGVVNTATTADNEEAEYSILIRSDLQGQGLGSLLMNKMINYCHSRHTKTIFGLVLSSNDDMLALVEKLGFKIKSLEGDYEMVEVRLGLQSQLSSD